jgi:hypothetical protein
MAKIALLMASGSVAQAAMTWRSSRLSPSHGAPSGLRQGSSCCAPGESGIGVGRSLLRPAFARGPVAISLSLSDFCFFASEMRLDRSDFGTR